MKYFLTIILLIASASILHAQPGTIDNTYGTDKTGTVSVFNQVYTGAAAIQSDDKLVVGGTPVAPQSGSYILARHNNDGSPDASFGIEGQVTTSIDDLVKNIRYSYGWTSIAFQPDGKIVAAGSIGWNNPDYPPEYHAQFDIDIVIARFLPDGTPDESFGTGGRVVTNLGYLENISAVAVQADGKIVVAGDQTLDFANGNSNGILVVRYNKDGSIDESFGKYQGYTVYDNNGGGNYGNAMLLQPDGKIVVGGSQLGANAFLVLRYLPNGSLDGSFGNGGAAQTTFSYPGSYTQINSLALDEKGRIIATGSIGSVYGVGVSRYLPDGAPDNSFNKSGKLELSYNDFPVIYASGFQVLLQPENKLVITSQVSDQINNTSTVLALTGLNEDGTKDASFGTDKGQTITDIDYVIDPTHVSSVMQSDGKVIVVGDNFNTYMLTRFNGYPVHVSLAVRIKRFIHNHSITWNGLPADDHIASYSVEQSSLSTKGFTPIAKLSGRSNLRDYSLNNTNLLQGTNYYRVKAVSTDGTICYSEVVSADNVANNASVFPNPAKSYVTVQGLQSNATANISIKDGSGTVLSKGVSSGSTQYRSQVSNLLPGTYYLNITTSGKTETLPFIKE